MAGQRTGTTVTAIRAQGSYSYGQGQSSFSY